MNAGNPAIGLNTALGALLEVPVLFLSVPLIRRFGETRLIAFAAAMQELHDDGTYDEILEFWGVEVGRVDAITVNAGTE